MPHMPFGQTEADPFRTRTTKSSKFWDFVHFGKGGIESPKLESAHLSIAPKMLSQWIINEQAPQSSIMSAQMCTFTKN